MGIVTCLDDSRHPHTEIYLLRTFVVVYPVVLSTSLRMVFDDMTVVAKVQITEAPTNHQMPV